MTHKHVYRPSTQLIVFTVAIGILVWTVITAGIRYIS